MGSQADRISAELRNAVETVVKKVTLDVTANLKAAPSEGGTPVDTGNARAQWTPQIGKPFRAQGMPLSDQDVPAFVSSAGSRSDVGVLSVATKYKLKSGPIYISNNAPYIMKLNQGHSNQAPAFFIQRAISKAVNQRYNINVRVNGVKL